MSNVDLVSKFTVLFTLRASLSQTDVLLGNHRGLPIELLRLFKKQFFSYMKLIFALHIELLSVFLCLYIFLSIFLYRSMTPIMF